MIIDTVLEHGSEKHRQMALEYLLTGRLEFATNEPDSKSVVKALKEDGKRRSTAWCSAWASRRKATLSFLPSSSRD
jgi:hypothetical protein